MKQVVEHNHYVRALFEHVSVGLACLSLDGYWLEVNQKVCDITGYTREELLQHSFHTLLSPEDLPAELACMQRVLQGGLETYSAERRCVRKDAVLTWVHVTCSLVRDEMGTPLYFVCSIEDIQAHMQADARMANQVDQLQVANHRMEDFLNLASHELRTPLTTIKANVQLAMRRLRNVLQQPGVNDLPGKIEAARDMLTRAESQIGVLNRLVRDMVDVSRIRSGRLQLQVSKVPCDLGALLRGAIQEQEQRQTTHQIIVHLPDAPQTVLVLTDAERISQVITHYLTNAMKYSQADQPVEVTLATDEQWARVSVRDHGPGLGEEDQQRVWERFYQSPRARVLSGSGMGLGLGLYISRMLIEQQHGETGVESVLEDGSTFWFRLPIAHV
ncbi:MAG TPA: PAS domain S-box protein [Ktedonobacteraceae bacterium]|nr:PAS domain S-box protein [Ktedonobacteraceae bacterium]